MFIVCLAFSWITGFKFPVHACLCVCVCVFGRRVHLSDAAQRSPGLQIPAVTMAAAAGVMRVRAGETGSLVKI